MNGATNNRPSFWRAWALRPMGARQWDFLLRATGVVGAAAILLVEFVTVAPIGDLAVFFSLTLFVNGPYSPLMPVAFEPMLMAYGQLYSPLLVAAVGVSGQVLVEAVNYHLYHAAMRSAMMTKARESRVVRTTIKSFETQPFLTIFVCALTPIPFWIVRIVAPLAGYPIRRYLAATALGRFPRLWFYAAIGAMLPIGGGLVFGVGLAVTVILAVLIAWHRIAASRAVRPVA
jgi:uncharacterized membrane protein YdjX (TVP38/TMEM64 family)